MISEKEAVRVAQWVDEAVASGARVVIGGERDGAKLFPTVVADVTPSMRISREEVFGPTLSVTRAATIDEAAAIGHCRDALAIYKVPVRVLEVDEFPTTPSANGTKIKKAELRRIAATTL